MTRREPGDVDAAKAKTALDSSGSLSDEEDSEVATEADRLPTVSRAFYHFIEEQGHGGLGRVLRARDKRTQRIVAVKEVLDPDHAMARARLAREALITANLQHPSIVPVYEVGRWFDGQPFYSMKLVEGATLREAIEKTNSASERIGLLHHVTAVAEALAYAHSKGVVHRDLKPANILVGPFGETVVIDWGLARASHIDDEQDNGEDLSLISPVLTRAGSVMGTPAYMAPEQARGQECDERSDVYALGAVLYHLLTGEAPYKDSTSVVDDLLVGPPSELSEMAPELPPDLVAIVRRAMERDPADRYADASELADELRRFETGKLVAAHAYSVRQLIARWLRRNRITVAVASVLLVALAASAAIGVVRIRGERDRALLAEAEAKDANAEARAHLADVHEELGHRELAVDAPFRALPHLEEAARLRGELNHVVANAAGRAIAAATTTESSHPTRGPITALGISRDRLWAGLGIADKMVELWDLRAGKPTATFEIGEQIYDIEIDPGAKHVWVAGAGGIVRFVDGVKQPAFEGVFSRMASTRDGKFAIATRMDGAVETRRWPTGELVSRFTSPSEKAIGSLALAMDDKRIVAIANDSSEARLFSRDGALIADLGPATYVEVSPDGQEFALSRPGLVTVARSSDGEELLRVEFPSTINGITYVADGRLIAGAGADVALISTVDGSKTKLAGHYASAPFMPDAALARSQFATSIGAGHVRLWNADGTGIGELRFAEGFAIAIVVSVDGDVLVGTQNGQRYFWRHEKAHNRPALVGHADRTRRLAYSKRGDRIATGSEDKLVKVWNSETGYEVTTLRGHQSRITWLEYSPDDRVLATAGGDGEIILWDTATATKLSSLLGHTADIQQVRWSSAGEFLASAGSDGSLRVWSPDGSQRCVANSDGEKRGVAIAPDDSAIAVFGEGPIRLYDAKNCSPVREFDTGQQLTLKAGYSADGRQLVAVGYAERDTPDRSALIFDVSNAEVPPRILAGYRRLVAAVALSPDGTKAAIGDDGGNLFEWELSTGRRTGAFYGVEDVIGDVAYAHDGKILAAGTDGGGLVSFDSTSGAMIEKRTLHQSGIYFIRAHPHGQTIATAALEPVPRLTRLHRFSGTVAELGKIARCKSPWRIGERRRLVLAKTDCSD